MQPFVQIRLFFNQLHFHAAFNSGKTKQNTEVLAKHHDRGGVGERRAAKVGQL